MSHLIDLTAARDRLAAEMRERILEKAPLTEYAPPAGQGTTITVETGSDLHRMLVTTAAAAAADVVDTVSSRTGADLEGLEEVVQAVQLWARGLDRDGSLRAALRAVKRFRRRLAKRTPRFVEACGFACRDDVVDFDSYVAASIRLLEHRGERAAGAMVRALVRLARGKMSEVTRLVRKGGLAKARLVVADFLRDPEVVARARDFGAVAGALYASHAFEYSHAAAWHACRGIDIIEGAAGCAAMPCLAGSCFWWIEWAMADVTAALGANALRA